MSVCQCVCLSVTLARWQHCIDPAARAVWGDLKWTNQKPGKLTNQKPRKWTNQKQASTANQLLMQVLRNDRQPPYNHYSQPHGSSLHHSMQVLRNDSQHVYHNDYDSPHVAKCIDGSSVHSAHLINKTNTQSDHPNNLTTSSIRPTH